MSPGPRTRAARLGGAVARGSGVIGELPALSAADVEAMAGACPGVDELPVLPLLLDRAGRGPLLVEELLTTAVEAGTLSRSAAGWTYRADAVAQAVLAALRACTDAQLKQIVDSATQNAALV